MSSQDCVGYGVMTDGKPSGIWPVSSDMAFKTVERRLAQEPNALYEVVPVYIGSPITKIHSPTLQPKTTA